MKKRKSFITNMILALLCASILIPVASLVVWVFTERWAWPDLFPQVLSDRAVMEIVRRKGELVSLMASSVMISSVVAVLSAVIGILTSRALVLYRFRGKDLMSFFTVLPLMVPGTVFAMGIQITFIRLGLNNTVAGGHSGTPDLFPALRGVPHYGRHPGSGHCAGGAGPGAGGRFLSGVQKDHTANAGSGDTVGSQHVIHCILQPVFSDTASWRRQGKNLCGCDGSLLTERQPEYCLYLQHFVHGHHPSGICCV